ncbi:hypothetical protein ACIPVK_15805 [Paeniglutamicibacter sp. MACA_103]
MCRAATCLGLGPGPAAGPDRTDDLAVAAKRDAPAKIMMHPWPEARIP